SSLDINSICTTGFLWIWVEKELIPDILLITEKKWGFRYVENFCWIKRNINNRIARQPARYFNKSKTTCLILRKEGEIELRHQRNPDCEFDYIKPRQPDDLTERKPSFLYEVIETLLPTAVYNAETNPNGEKLLELWARKGTRRKGWTTVVQNTPPPADAMDDDEITVPANEPVDLEKRTTLKSEEKGAIEMVVR
ncbi:hypothetical protein HK102_002627, partial [Quaeritorhiza haematococci]